ncbi:hypothetical protein C8F04DRAFT_1294533 [Mycena alexandri]|uniref:Uncharacterized protein n=1 Tax=Mycena alexandri TaxID=1745969 RepID=A0AAD6SGU8_9AGAR|nr:hypothetical protein C8F04DRAFT_1294533 [Mycena alexandri]
MSARPSLTCTVVPTPRQVDVLTQAGNYYVPIYRRGHASSTLYAVRPIDTDFPRVHTTRAAIPAARISIHVNVHTAWLPAPPSFAEYVCTSHHPPAAALFSSSSSTSSFARWCLTRFIGGTLLRLHRPLQAAPRRPHHQQHQHQHSTTPVKTRKLLQRFRQFLADEERFWCALVLRLHGALVLRLHGVPLPGGGGARRVGARARFYFHYEFDGERLGDMPRYREQYRAQGPPNGNFKRRKPYINTPAEKPNYTPARGQRGAPAEDLG